MDFSPTITPADLDAVLRLYSVSDLQPFGHDTIAQGLRIFVRLWFHADLRLPETWRQCTDNTA